MTALNYSELHELADELLTSNQLLQVEVMNETEKYKSLKQWADNTLSTLELRAASFKKALRVRRREVIIWRIVGAGLIAFIVLRKLWT